MLNRVGVFFALSSLANTAWVFAWHHNLIAVSVVLIVTLLACLLVINRIVLAAAPTRRETWLVQVPFSIYFGWLTVATVVNITVLLVSLNWDGFGLNETTRAVIVLVAVTAIGATTMLRNRDIAYGLVLIWAYLGILVIHTSADGFANRYPVVIATVIGCLAVFAIAEVALVIRRRSSTRALAHEVEKV